MPTRGEQVAQEIDSGRSVRRVDLKDLAVVLCSSRCFTIPEIAACTCTAAPPSHTNGPETCSARWTRRTSAAADALTRTNRTPKLASTATAGRGSRLWQSESAPGFSTLAKTTIARESESTAVLDLASIVPRVALTYLRRCVRRRETGSGQRRRGTIRTKPVARQGKRRTASA